MNHEEIVGGTAEESRGAARARRRRTLRRRRRAVVILVVAVLVVGAATLLSIGPIRSAFGEVLTSEDYEGTGEEAIEVTVPPGTSGREIADILVEADVIASSQPFLEALEDSGQAIQADTYQLRTRMSGASALDLMINPEALLRLVIPEGFRLDQIADRMVEQGFDAESVDDALDQSPADLDLPEDFPSLEGLLFPATYEITPGQTADDMVAEMAQRTRVELDDLGIADDEALEILTLASLVQIESPGDDEVRARVARVFLNRLGEDSQTGGLLQSDATVAYIFGARGDLTTTAEERESDNPYNTYRFPGLPPGPVNSPGRASVEAALDPADGPWQFFVAVDPDTGETRFAETYGEHLENVEIFRQWLRDHRDSQDAEGEG